MKKIIKLLKSYQHYVMLGLIALSMLTALAVYELTYIDEGAAKEAQIIFNASELYNKSLNSYVINSDYDLILSHEKNIYLDTTLSEKSEAKISYRNQSGSFQSTLDQTIKIADHSVDVTGAYENGIAYFTVGNGKFCSAMTPVEFTAKMISVGCLDSSLYGCITAIENSEYIKFLFSDSVGAEIWSIPEGAKFLQSSASATFRVDSMAINICYVVIYKYNDIVFSEQYDIQFTNSTSALSFPDLTGYTAVSDPVMPIVLERSCGYLLATQNLSSVTKETILCQTFGDERTSAYHVSMSDGKTFSASITTDIAHMSTSRGGEITQLVQAVNYKDGIYTLTVNGAEPTEKEDIKPDQMRAHCRDFFVGTILLPEDISAIQFEENSETYKYTFEANSPELIERLRQKASEDLYANKTQLDGLYQNEKVNAYLVIDKRTGFPVGAGIDYEGSHTINDIVYKLVYESLQTFQAENNVAN